MKKILFVASDNAAYSGAFRSMVKLCCLLRKSGKYDPIVVLPRKGNGQELLDNENIRWFYIRSFSWTIWEKDQGSSKVQLSMMTKRLYNQIFAITQIASLIRKEKVDIVHINTIWSYVGQQAAARCKIPCVWHIREALEIFQNRSLFSDKCYGLIDKADRVIDISEFIRDYYSPRLKTDRSLVIYNGIDEKDFYCERDFGNKKDVLEFLNVGSMNTNKGQEYIVEAAGMLKEEGINNFHISFIGSGEKRTVLEDMVNKKGLSENVTFYGDRSDVALFYKKSDAYIMSSISEPFGRVTVEAMMAGCIVIGADSGATPEVLDNGDAGVLYKSENSNDLHLKMRSVIEDYDKYIGIAKDGQKYAMENFTASKNADEIMKVYEKL